MNKTTRSYKAENSKKEKSISPEYEKELRILETYRRNKLISERTEDLLEGSLVYA